MILRSEFILHISCHVKKAILTTLINLGFFGLFISLTLMYLEKDINYLMVSSFLGKLVYKL
jgi:cytochrome c-type biogenesis protein CcmE